MTTVTTSSRNDDLSFELIEIEKERLFKNIHGFDLINWCNQLTPTIEMIKGWKNTHFFVTSEKRIYEDEEDDREETWYTRVIIVRREPGNRFFRWDYFAVDSFEEEEGVYYPETFHTYIHGKVNVEIMDTKEKDEILLFALVLMLPEKAIVTLFDDCGYSVRRLAKLSGLSEKMVMKRLQKRIPKDDKGIQCETKSNLGYATSRRRGVGAV